MALYSPFAFRPPQVTLWTTVIYFALLVPILFIQETVPRAPSEASLPTGISIAEAWADLAEITKEFHPANSHANDAVRSYLLQRIKEILNDNGISWALQEDSASGTALLQETSDSMTFASSSDAIVFDDMRANITFSSSHTSEKRSAIYFEGSNVYVYIRGTKDETGNWWSMSGPASAMRKQLVLVNAHFDSVSSGYGATDDGVGVVSALQLIRYFTIPEHQPERGIVVLFNNAEEDYLLGANAFANSPLAPYINTFVNMEGAGAGGRAILFRSTDLEVMNAYRNAPHPFGTVVASDGFKAGWVRSETDYRVWNQLGYRGIDMSFYRPRARYHTTEDDRRHTSKNSIWHMLSGALASTKSLSGAGGDLVDSSKTVGVWFDLFGDSLVLFALQGLFAWSVTILVVSPLILGLVAFFIYKTDKVYLFRAHAFAGDASSPDYISIGGWKGLFRFPLALGAAVGAVIGTALFIGKVQPFIIHSSIYAVFAVLITAFYVVFWSVMRAVDLVRPTALERTYAHLWLYAISWVLLVYSTVKENRDKVASVYIVVFWTSSVFLATTISLVEVFLLPRKSVFAESQRDIFVGQNNIGDAAGVLAIPASVDNAVEINREPAGEEEASSETSPLLRGLARNDRPTTFSTGYRRSVGALLGRRQEEASLLKSYNSEQEWSSHLPSWTWLVQFLLLGPFSIILVAQLGLALAFGINQTGTDGASLLMPIFFAAFFSVLLLLPLTPFIHRVSRHIPIVFAFTFAATLIYCLVSFPFSSNNPYKFDIRQTFSVDTGDTSVIVTGFENYISKIMSQLPSTASRPWFCQPSAGKLGGFVDCSFDGAGLDPTVEGTGEPFSGYAGLVTINASRSGAETKATLELDAVNTKSCSLRFNIPLKNVFIRNGGQDWDLRFDTAPTDGDWKVVDLALWRRDWTTPWVVDVEWAEESEAAGSATVLGGVVVCRWADVNIPGTAPAIDEAWQYAPDWAKLAIRSTQGAIQGTKSFSL